MESIHPEQDQDIAAACAAQMQLAADAFVTALERAKASILAVAAAPSPKMGALLNDRNQTIGRLRAEAASFDAKLQDVEILRKSDIAMVDFYKDQCETLTGKLRLVEQELAQLKGSAPGLAPASE